MKIVELGDVLTNVVMIIRHISRCVSGSAIQTHSTCILSMTVTMNIDARANAQHQINVTMFQKIAVMQI